MLVSVALASATKPHLMYLLVDDWGWANWGAHRPPDFPETVTPTLDRLASVEGVVLDHYYVHMYCSPSRSSLQTGRFPIHVNVVNADERVANPDDTLAGFAGVPRNMTTLAQKLKDVGYRTHFVGKWDCGMATHEHTPAGRGYDTSLLYFEHANDYWTMRGAPCGTAPVVDLWEGAGPAYAKANAASCAPGSPGAPPPNASASACVYEDDLFGDEVLRVVAAHDPAQPLFLVWAPHLVHAPLEVRTRPCPGGAITTSQGRVHPIHPPIRRYRLAPPHT